MTAALLLHRIASLRVTTDTRLCACVTLVVMPAAAVATMVTLSSHHHHRHDNTPAYAGHSKIPHANLPKFGETICTFRKFVVYRRTVAECFIFASAWRLRTTHPSNNDSRACVLLRYNVHLSSPEEKAVYGGTLRGNWMQKIFGNCSHISVFFRNNLYRLCKQLD